MDEALKTAFTSVLASPPGATSSGARLGYATLHRDVYAAANRGEEEVHALAALFHYAAASSLRSFLATLPAPQLLDEWQRVQNLDRFVIKLVSGRRRLLSLHPHLPAVGALAYRDLLAHHPAVLRVTAMAERGSGGSLCEGMDIEVAAPTRTDQHVNTQDEADDRNKTRLQSALETIHKGVVEAIAKAEEMSELRLALPEVQKPFPRTRFTRTKNILHDLDDISFLRPSAFSPDQVKYVDLHLDQMGFVLENVFSVDECRALISESKRVGYGSLEGEFLPSMRDNKRALIMCPKLADELWNRVKSFIERDARVLALRPFGFNAQGTWKPTRLNPLFRFCEYTAPSVGFVPHRDASFIGGSEERSIFTIMLYLNDEFEDGTTNFLHSHTGGRIDETIDEELKRGYDVVYKLRPKPGLCVIFEHTILHEGAPVPQGHKYLLRTDVVFQRTENPKAGDESYRTHPLYRRMVQYYKDAADEECHGRVDKSSELYERALSIRQWYREASS